MRRSSAATNTDATFTSSLPSGTPLPPWCGVPMKKMPYVDVFIERCSFSALSRAASEWMSACSISQGEDRQKARLTLLTMMPPRLCATKIIGLFVVCHNQYTVRSCQPLLWSEITSVSSLSKHRSDTKVLAWSYRYWQLTCLP
jgi:hypothetical protein